VFCFVVDLAARLGSVSFVALVAEQKACVHTRAQIAIGEMESNSTLLRRACSESE
jgi:hypothetical protein